MVYSKHFYLEIHSKWCRSFWLLVHRENLETTLWLSWYLMTVAEQFHRQLRNVLIKFRFSNLRWHYNNKKLSSSPTHKVIISCKRYFIGTLPNHWFETTFDNCIVMQVLNQITMPKLTKIIQTYCEKKLWSRKTFEIRGWRPGIFKKFEITRTFYSNSE